jgi:phage protein D
MAVNGRDEPELTAALLDLTIVDDGHAPAACTARFSNRDGRGDGFRFFDLRHFDFGAAVQVALGEATLFAGRLHAIDADFPTAAPPTIAIRCRDRLADLDRSRRSRTFEMTTDADLVRRIVSEHGLTSVVELTGPIHDATSQLQQTDLEFLRERLRHIDAVLWADRDAIHVRHTADRDHGTIALAWGDDLLTLSAAADLTSQRTRVVVSGWDVTTKSPIESVADAGVLASEIGDGRSGAAMLSSTLGPRTERVADSGAAPAAIAQASAAAQFAAAARQFVVVRGESSGSPAMRVGSRVAVSRVGELFSGTYYVSQVRHRFDLEAGFRTAFTAYTACLAPAR